MTSPPGPARSDPARSDATALRAPARHRIVVTAGNPTDDELAAVAAALAGHDDGGPRPAPPSSRWTRAARLEACGHPPIDSPDRFPR